MIPMPPFGLMAGAVIAIVVAASGWYIISGLRAADRAEIESLLRSPTATRRPQPRRSATPSTMPRRCRRRATRTTSESRTFIEG